MKYLACVFLLIPSFVFTQNLVLDTIQHDGIARDFIINYPSYYDGSEPMPLVFNFHGFGSNSTQQMFYGDFRSILERDGFIVVHPEGTLINGQSHWNVGGFTTGSTTDDVGFTSAMIDYLSENYNIDPERIYATGMSNGGYMSYELACQLGDRIAAIASVTGSMTPETFENCNPTHPTPIMEIHGTADLVVSYEGSSFSKPISEVMDYWIGFNNCITSPKVTEIADTDLNDASSATHFVYKDCDNNITNEHFKITGGDHSWPGAFIGGAGTNRDMNASEEIWKFFSRHTLTGEGVSDLNDEFIPASANVYPNPSNGLFQIDSPNSQNYYLLSPLGNVIHNGTLQEGNQDLNLTQLASGTYFFKTNTKTQKLFIIR